MTEVLRTSWSVARASWLATWNRTFRFSKMKAAVIFVLLQGLIVLLIAQRTPKVMLAPGPSALTGPVALMCLQMAWFGLMYGFSRGQFQLYQGILVPLLQVTPARPLGFLLGRVLESLPSRAWSCLLWGYAYSSIVPAAQRWPAFLLMASLGLVVGTASHLSGLLLLALWSRCSPRSMRTGLLLFGAISLGLTTWAAIFLARGGTITELALTLRAYRPLVIGSLLAAAGLPSLVLMGLMLIRPQTVEDLYRQGLFQLMELREQDLSRPGRSRWLPLRSPVLRAVLSREWLELGRSSMTRIQLMIWAAGTVGVYFAGQAAAGRPMPEVIRFVGVLSLFSWFMAYGHWVVRVFEKERLTLLLYRLAAVPTPHLLLAKFLSIFVPSGLLVTASALVGSLSAGLTLGETLTLLGWSLGALAAGILGGFGMAAATAGQEPEEQSPQAAGDDQGESVQATGSAWWSLARVASLMLTAALPLWIGAEQPGLPSPLPSLLLVLLAALLPLGLLAAGVRLMLRTWGRNG